MCYNPVMSWFYRVKWSVRMIWRTVRELAGDFGDYYLSPYPFLLIIGALRRLVRRIKPIWVPRGRGRPQISEEVTNLILDMKRSNWGWGALRISQELALLGIKVSKTTVAAILKKNGLTPPRTRMTPISWEAFFHHHKHLWAMDFLCVFDAKGTQIFVLVILDIVTRELVSINATLNPNRNWIIEQFCNAECSGYKHPTMLIADNDGIYGNWLDPSLKELFGIDVHHIPFKQPWKNGRCERFHLSLKSEILQRVDVRDVAHARQLCAKYQAHYNGNRPHQSLDGMEPANRSSKWNDGEVKSADFSYTKTKVVGGLVTEFALAA